MQPNSHRQGARLSPTSTDVICWLCSPSSSYACLPLRTSQKRSVPLKWPDTSSAPSALSASAVQLEGNTRSRRQ